ncbi:MAG: hypothetical protein AAF735_04575, partial [Myxococcota bacterium]
SGLAVKVGLGLVAATFGAPVATGIGIAALAYGLYNTDFGALRTSITNIGSGNGTPADFEAAGELASMLVGVGKGRGGGKNPAPTSPKVGNSGPKGGGNPRFVAERNGTVVDTHATPPGSYSQPGRQVANGRANARTDVLQRVDHGAGHSHTHDPIVRTSPDGREFVGGTQRPGRPVSFEDVQNIQSGAATRS